MDSGLVVVAAGIAPWYVAVPAGILLFLGLRLRDRD